MSTAAGRFASRSTWTGSRASCARLGLELLARPELEGLVALALDEAGEAEAVLRVYATPGSGQGPVALVVVSELPLDLDELRARGIRVITVEFRPADLIGGVKSTSYALNMMAVDEARARDADDALFVSADGTVLEGTTSNVWWRRGTTLATPGEGGILAGVTRDVLLEAGAGLGYEVVEGTYTVDDLAAGDEAFARSSIREVMPIVALDGRPIGDGKPGEAAATAPGSAAGTGVSVRVKTLSAIHRAIYSATGGRVGKRIAGMPVLLLTTMGRKTGKQRTSPLTYFEDGRRDRARRFLRGPAAQPGLVREPHGRR